MDKIKKLIANQLGISESKLNENSRFVEDLNADSLDMVEMMMTLEEEYSISISDEESVQIKTINDVCNLVDRKKK